MENNLTITNNTLHGLFLTNIQHLYNDDSLSTLPAYNNILILKEFNDAVFIRLSGEVERAETLSFFFSRYNKDKGRQYNLDRCKKKQNQSYNKFNLILTIMSGRYIVVQTIEQIEKRFNVKVRESEKLNYNLGVGQYAPVITNDNSLLSTRYLKPLLLHI